MKKSEQIRNLRKVLGSNADLIDLDARVDGRLSYTENKRIILNRAKKLRLRKNPKMTFKGTPLFLVDKAEQIQAKRNIKERARDGSSTSKKTFKAKSLTYSEFLKWKRNPRRYDIIGVDTKGSHIKKTKSKKLTQKQIRDAEADIL